MNTCRKLSLIGWSSIKCNFCQYLFKIFGKKLQQKNSTDYYQKWLILSVKHFAEKWKLGTCIIFLISLYNIVIFTPQKRRKAIIETIAVILIQSSASQNMYLAWQLVNTMLILSKSGWVAIRQLKRFSYVYRFLERSSQFVIRN